VSTADIISAISAGATTLAVIAAFVIQRLQANADRRLAREQRAEMRLGAVAAALDAMDAMMDAARWGRGVGSGNAYSFSERLNWSLDALSYFMTQPIVDPELIGAIIIVRSMVQDTRDDFSPLLRDPLEFEQENRQRMAGQVEAKAKVIASCQQKLSHVRASCEADLTGRGKASVHAASLAAKAASEGR